ncbi:MAG TPA: hypothetical protein VMB85_18100 [Bryobacteraceae bacterium]|nr:hypothetical protein [Bryobacteraceae bacterium]
MTCLEHARCWFVRSGIQDAAGGVARYYRSAENRNAPVSNEITGYAASALVYFGDLDGARRAACYLRDRAWNAESQTFPFEPDSPLAYFFDAGIIARGLLSVARATGDDSFRDAARDAALSLAFDFLGENAFHPIISLPEKQPLGYEPRWSRSPGCYQLKAALAWREIGDADANRLFESALGQALATHQNFLDEPDREKLMDRLHAYCYFLEGLLGAADRSEARPALQQGIDRVAALLREISPEFERSDVCAQLLRVRLIAHHQQGMPLDEAAAREEAQRTASYQSHEGDPRLRGGFWFGKKRGALLPFMNPVSTAFAAQALALWEQHSAGSWNFTLDQLI